jgi:Helix-hairpin-helix domain
MPAVAIGPPVAIAPPASPAPIPAAAAVAVPASPSAVAATPAAATPARADAPPPAPAASVRPIAPGMTDADGPLVSIADTFERLLSLEDLDAGFASIEGSADAMGSLGVAPTDLAEVRELFAQLAVNHVRQVRDFMIDLRWRDATLDWIGICEPALRSLRRAADKLELREMCVALDAFAEALTATRVGGGRMIDGERRDTLLARFDDLATLMPRAFALDLDRTQREAVILQSLLLQVPDVKKVTLDKIYAAGMTTLEALFLATASDIAATTGIGEALAARIVERFCAYREQVKAAAPDAARTRERERIGQLTARLRLEHDAFELAGQSWTREAEEQRKAARKARGQTLLDIRVVLARLGEVERLDELERLPFERKVTHLESFLDEARKKYAAQS